MVVHRAPSEKRVILILGLCVLWFRPFSWFAHKVDIKVSDVSLSLTMSTVIGLGDLTEDEIIPRPLPVEILLRNVRLNLVEDRPPVNITSPGPVPMNVAIGELKVMRDSSGVFHLQPSRSAFRSELIATANAIRNPEREKEVLSLQLILKQLKMDNDNLRRQLTVADRQHEQNRYVIVVRNRMATAAIVVVGLPRCRMKVI